MKATIRPVQVWPSTATRLYVRAGNLGPPPSFYWELQRVVAVPGSPAVDPVGFPGEPGFVAGTPEVPASEITECLKNGNDTMSAEQWDEWNSAADDETYILAAVAANLGLRLA